MMYKQCIAACAILMLSFSTSSALAAADAKDSSSKVQMQVGKSWKLPSKPLDVVYSLDNKKVFILTDQEQILIYTAAGALLGKVKVAKGVSAIDIAPRGEKLYLINQVDNTFTDLSLDYVVTINTKGSPFLGKENAPVTIAVFTDFE
jgi:DNA-binding beta-propeller fold protein YncE